MRLLRIFASAAVCALAASTLAAHPAWGTQPFANAIWRMDPHGHVTYVVRPATTLGRGMSIWKDRNGNTYSVEENNHRRRETLIVKRDATGAVRVLAGSQYGHADGAGQRARFANIVALTFGPDSSLYVTDDSSVRRVSLSGVVTTLATGLDAPDKNSLSFGNLMGIAVSRTNDVYVADFRNRRVLKLDPNGRSSVMVRSAPPWLPTGVAVGPAGDLYVLEFGFEPPKTWIKPRVRKVSRDGVALIVAIVSR